MYLGFMWKSLILNLFIGIFIISITIGCKKNTNEPDVFIIDTSIAINDTVWANNDTFPSITSVLIQPNAVDSFRNNDDFTVRMMDGSTVKFPIGGCLNSGQNPSPLPPQTLIRSEISIIRSKGDLIKCGISTLGNNNSLMEASAIVNINMFNKKGNKELLWDVNNPFKIIDIKLISNKVDTSAKFYYYQSGSNTLKDSNWIASPNTGIPPLNPPRVMYNQSSYAILSNRIGWFGLMKPINQTLSKIKLAAYLPLNFTNKNTIVYAVFDNSKSVVRLKSDARGKTFSTPNIPANSNVTIVSLSLIGNEFYLGTKKSTATTNNSPLKVLPTKKTLQEIVLFLDSLK